MRVVADVCQEIDITAQPGQSDSNVERTAADMLADSLTAPLDDVDQRFADHQPTGHFAALLLIASLCIVAGAPPGRRSCSSLRSVASAKSLTLRRAFGQQRL
jgi:hypothetical protein